MATATTVQVTKEEAHQLRRVDVDLPPTPPESKQSTPADSEHEDSAHGDDEEPDHSDYPLPPHSKPPTQVLDIDKKTPDSWLPRDPRLIRLTGVHPFNVEPPLSDLYNEGFLTSPELFYVRNHGAVPQVQDEDIPDWEFSIEGYVLVDPSIQPR